MKNNYLTIILLIICGILLYLWQKKPDIVTIKDKIAKLDSSGFMVNKTAKPDIVIKEIIRTKIIKEIVHDTTYLDTSKFIIVHDTIFLESKAPFVKSIKKFSAEYLKGEVIAFAPCAVDSFQIKTGLDRKAFTKLYLKECESPYTKWYYLLAGFGGGITLKSLL